MPRVADARIPSPARRASSSETTRSTAPDTSCFSLQEGGGLSWPGIDNDEDLADRLAAQMNWDAPVFQSAEAFIDANGEESDKPPAEAPADHVSDTERDDETRTPTRS